MIVNKRKIIICIIVAILILLLAAGGIFIYCMRQQYWGPWGTELLPDTFGTEWVSQDGSVKISTTEKYDSYTSTGPNGKEYAFMGGEITEGTISVGGKTVEVYATTNHYGTLDFWVKQGAYADVYHHNMTYIEQWEAVDKEETDTEVVFTMKVNKTTYFTVGQEIELIYKKPK